MKLTREAASLQVCGRIFTHLGRQRPKGTRCRALRGSKFETKDRRMQFAVTPRGHRRALSPQFWIQAPHLDDERNKDLEHRVTGPQTASF